MAKKVVGAQMAGAVEGRLKAGAAKGAQMAVGVKAVRAVRAVRAVAKMEQATN